MIGIGTALADDPRLDCRLPGLADRSPARIIVDARMQLPLTSQLVRSAHERPTWLLVVAGAAAKRRAAYKAAGLRLIEVEAADDGRLDLAAGVRALGALGLTRVLVEGGARLAAGLLRAGLVDRLIWFRAPRVMGGDGLPAAVGFGVESLDGAPAYRRVAVAEVGDDLMETYTRMP